MAREPTRDGQSLTPAVWVRVHGQPCPRKRQLGSDPGSAGLIEELNEPFEQPAVLGHLEAEPATDLQIVGKRFLKRGHATPPRDGHGRTSPPNAVRSTLA
jgi:hypothetical protein